MGAKSDFYEELSSRIITSHLQPFQHSCVANLKPAREDLEIFDSNSGEKVGICEVKAQLDEATESLHTEIIKRRRLIEELSDHEGIWDVRVKKSFSFKKSHESLRLAYFYAISTNSDLDVRVPQGGSENNILMVMRTNEITSIRKVGGSVQAKVFLHQESSAAFIPDEVQGLDAWIQGHLPEYKNSLDRLRHSALPQRHFFIWLSDATPTEVRAPAMFHPTKLPLEIPTGLDFVTHFWIGVSIQQDGTCIAWLYQVGSCWKAVITNQVDFLKGALANEN